MSDAVQTRYTALPLRDHTILGVCEAIGEDFGFDPIWLRVPLAASVLFSIKYAIAGYLLLGVVVLASRLLFPQPKADAVISAEIAPESDATEQRPELPLAA